MECKVPSKRFVVLDSFRGLSAICVVFFHMNILDTLTTFSFFRNSHIFVEFFFILSGFVLANGYGFRSEINFLNFILSRIFRLFPLHIFMLGIFVFFEVCKFIAFQNYGFEFNTAPFTDSYAVSQIIPNLLLVQAWFPFFDATTFNYPSWSISVEFFLYLTFFLTLFFSEFSKLFIWLLFTILMFYLLSANFFMLTDELQRGMAFFFLGTIINFLQQKINFFTMNKAIAGFLESLVFLLIYLFVAGDVENNYVLAGSLFSVTILVFSFEAGFISRILTRHFFQFIGVLSYSIYMVHVAVLFVSFSVFMIVGKFVGKNFTPFIDGERYINTSNHILNNVLSVFILVIVILVSYFTHRLVEKPCIDIGRRLVKNKSPDCVNKNT